MGTAVGQGKGFCTAGEQSDDWIRRVKNMAEELNKGQRFTINERNSVTALMTLPGVF